MSTFSAAKVSLPPAGDGWSLVLHRGPFQINSCFTV